MPRRIAWVYSEIEQEDMPGKLNWVISWRDAWTDCSSLSKVSEFRSRRRTH